MHFSRSAYGSLPGNSNCPLPGDVYGSLPGNICSPCLGRLPVPCLGTLASSLPGNACQSLPGTLAGALPGHAYRFPAWERSPVPCLGRLPVPCLGMLASPCMGRLPVPCLGTLTGSLPGSGCQFPAWEHYAGLGTPSLSPFFFVHNCATFSLMYHKPSKIKSAQQHSGVPASQPCYANQHQRGGGGACVRKRARGGSKEGGKEKRKEQLGVSDKYNADCLIFRGRSPSSPSCGPLHWSSVVSIAVMHRFASDPLLADVAPLLRHQPVT